MMMYKFRSILLALAALLLAAACGKSAHIGGALPEPVKPTVNQFYAARLAEAGSLTAGGFTVQCLDAELHDAPAMLSRLELCATQGSLELSFSSDTHESAYLYVRPPADSQLVDLKLDSASEVIGVVLPGRLDGVLPVGVADAAGEVGLEFRLTLAFGQGESLGPVVFTSGGKRPQAIKSASVPFEGELQRVSDLEVDVDSQQVGLSWTEVTTGDYDNSGRVNIADITPVAVHFQQLVSEHPDAEIVDGDHNGQVQIADITPLARNFGRSITGYDVFALTIPSLAAEVSEDDFFSVPPFDDNETPSEPRPSVKRTRFYIGDPPIAPPTRINYYYGREMPAGTYAFAVRAFSQVADDYGAVHFSNIRKADLTGSGENRPPIWMGAVGLISATPAKGQVTLTFGDATDPDGDDIYYTLYYEEGLTVDTATAQSIRLDRSSFTGLPPFSHTVTSLANGTTYAFLVRIYDEDDLEESPPNIVVLTATPQPYTPSPFPWPSFRKDEQNTGRLEGSSLREPLSIQWQREYRVTGTHNASCPVLDDGRVYIASQDGYLACFGQISPDSTHYSQKVTTQFSDSTISLYGDYLAVGGAGAYFILDREDGTSRGQYGLASGLPVKSSPLVVEGVAYAGDLDGNVHAFDIIDGSEVWSVSLNSGAINCAPVTDGVYIYVASRNGYIHKLDRETGDEILRSPADLGTISTSSPVLYPRESPAVLLVGTDFVEGGDNAAYALRLSDLATVAAYVTDFGVEGSPLVVSRGDVEMVVVGQGRFSTMPPIDSGKIAAYDLQTGALLWQTADIGRIYASPVASDTRVFAGSQNGNFYVLDFYGAIKQTVDLAAPIHSSAALIADRVYVTNSNSVLTMLQMNPDMTAPVWVGEEGIRSVSTGFGEATVNWDYATDDFYGRKVYYHICYGTTPAFDWDDPQVKDIADTGASTHSYTIDGLEDGERYYFAVRVSDRRLDDDPNMDANENYLGATPPWNVLDELVVGVDLPEIWSITYFDAAQSAGIVEFALGSEHPADHTGNVYYLTWDGESTTFEGPILAPAPDEFLPRQVELSHGFSGEPVISFSGWDYYRTATRTAPETWSIDTLATISLPTQPVISTAFGTDIRMQACNDLVTSFPPDETLDLRARRGDTTSWQSFEEPDPDTEKSMHLKALIADFGSGEEQMVLYEKALDHYEASTFPSKGELWLAEYAEGTWSTELLDAGENLGDSNTGRNLTTLFASQTLYLAYLDLKASTNPPIAFIRYATYDGTAFTVENAFPVDLPDPDDKAANYYHNVDIALLDGRPAIASFSRQTDPPDDVNAFHWADVYFGWRQPAGDWDTEVVAESVPLYMHFNAPIVLLPNESADYPLLIYASGPGSADRLIIWQRGPL
jgi:outer membrane protein assembly factor BamB